MMMMTMREKEGKVILQIQECRTKRIGQSQGKIMFRVPDTSHAMRNQLVLFAHPVTLDGISCYDSQSLRQSVYPDRFAVGTAQTATVPPNLRHQCFAP
jgi:hypothetical protein